MTKQLQKNFDLWSTQKYSKVSKICLACAGIFFRVTHMFKPTVDVDIYANSSLISNALPKNSTIEQTLVLNGCTVQLRKLRSNILENCYFVLFQ